MITDLGAKTAAETLTFSLDFTAEIGADPINTLSIVGASGVTVGTPTNSGAVVSFQVSDGTAGESYSFEVQCTTAGAQTIRRAVHLAVVDKR